MTMSLPDRPPVIMILAGEPSGDKHAAGVLRELKKDIPSLRAFGMGGDCLQDEGMEILYHIRQTSIMGFAEVVKHLPFILRMKKDLAAKLKSEKPDLVLMVDYPGFNLRFAETVKKEGIPVWYYISPQVWAWGKKRVKKIRETVTRMLCILPFEEEFYSGYQVPATFVGHPLIEQIQVKETPEAFFKSHGFPLEKPLIGLLPGSRMQEIVSLLPVMIDAVKPLIEKGAIRAVVAGVNHLPQSVYEPARLMEIPVVTGKTHEIMSFSTLAVVASGTATLETGLCGTPLVVVYKTSWLTYMIGRYIIRLDKISLVNIISNDHVVPELIQDDANPEALRTILSRWLSHPDEADQIREKLKKLAGLLGSKSASREAAALIGKALNQPAGKI